MPNTPHRTASLLEVTRDLLKKDNRPQLEIHKQSGIPFHWLRKFSAGEIKDPSVNTVQALYEFLTNKPLLLP